MTLLPARWVVALTLVAVFVALIAYGWRTDWVPYSLDCLMPVACWPAPGETVAARLSAEHFVQFGGQEWFLESTGRPQPGQPNVVYTHNMNTGAFVIYGVALLGTDISTTFWPVGVVDAAILCLGLLYGYLLAKRATGQVMFSLLFFVLLATDYHFSFAFGLNALRNWHWLALFGAAYHLLRAIERYPAWNVRHVAAFMGFAVVGFMNGYDFAAIQGLFCLAVAFAFTAGIRSYRAATSIVGAVVVAFMVPFVLRQLQVIGYLGLDFWWRDLYYSAVIKTSFLSRSFPLESMEVIDRWYVDHHVLRPPAVPETDNATIARTAWQMFDLTWVKNLGWLTIGLAASGCLLALGTVVAEQFRCWRRQLPTACQLSSAVGPGDPVPAQLDRPARFVTCLLLSQTVGIYFFSPLSIHIYIQHAFPAIISTLHAGQAFLVIAIAALVTRLVSRGAAPTVPADAPLVTPLSVRRLGTIATAVGAALLLAWHANVQVANALAMPLYPQSITASYSTLVPETRTAACPGGDARPKDRAGADCRAVVETLPATAQPVVLYVARLAELSTTRPVRGVDGSSVLPGPGDYVFAGDTYEVWRLGDDGRPVLLVGTPGQRLTLPSLGTLDVATGRYSGLDVVARDRRWVPDLTRLTAFTAQPRFFRISPDGRAPLTWDLNPVSTAHRIERQLDDGGPYLRLTFDENSRMFRIYRVEAIPDARPAPLSVHAEARASSRGTQELGVAERRPGGRSDTHTTTAPATGAWTSLVLNVAATNGTGMPKEISYALRDAREGDWFDVRRITVYVGIVP